MEFVDRVSAYPNRYTMTNENGIVSYVVIERADEPVIPGTPLNAETLNRMYEGVESEERPGCYYRTIDGETEWVTPPMLPNVEYRTTERYNGLPVYVKRVVFRNSNMAEAYLYGYTFVSCSAVFRDEEGIFAMLPTYNNDGSVGAFAKINSVQSVLMPEDFPYVFAEIVAPGVTDYSCFEMTVKYIKG